MLVIKVALTLGLASIPSLSVLAADDISSANQRQESIASNSLQAVNNRDDLERDEQLTPTAPSPRQTDSDITRLLRKQLFNRYFPKNWSWW